MVYYRFVCNIALPSVLFYNFRNWCLVDTNRIIYKNLSPERATGVRDQLLLCKDPD